MKDYLLCNIFEVEDRSTWPVWVTEKGVSIPIDKLATGHLVNILKYMDRRVESEKHHVAYCTTYINEDFVSGIESADKSYWIVNGKWKIFEIPEKSRPEAIRRIHAMPKQKFFETFSIHYPYLMKEARRRDLHIEGILE